jgi:hypothetical protein
MTMFSSNQFYHSSVQTREGEQQSHEVTIIHLHSPSIDDYHTQNV